MSVPFSQAWTVATYVLRQKLRGVRRYPLVLMLEPLFRCNLACAGCGKIQFPAEILRRQLTPEQCFAAADECGAPVISIPGGEPLLHSQIDAIVAGLVQRRKFIYLCTNALKLAEALPRFTPSKYLAFSVHMDGPRHEHDLAVCRQGTYDTAVRAIQAARTRGFRVTTNTTLFAGANPERVRGFFDEMMALGVEGMMISPGYSYEKAPDQDHFLHREQTTNLFRAVLARPWSARSASGGSRLAERDDHPSRARRTWKFNQTPLFLEFLQGRFDLECTPWGSPTYNIFGWQRPCYLIGEGYCQSFRELMETTDWSAYGRQSGNPKCRNCMVHCGYEPSAVAATFNSVSGLIRTARLTIGAA